ncbi:GNAT family N-acetyltransferase [Leucobacter sp. M11]|uniref:GNAT family N-acetyltransferase n=1 Tax=Leucobacter sp. M11 TaxID=2993565 RepID=UPI002D7FFE6D|nr:GNAT family N-acetyltransferase [Leucobacter sp. M11]MEB4613075.1 GNAT family N-acetyltransferase [Leucobacter sp. M11]
MTCFLRLATDRDLPALRQIETEADALLIDALRPDSWDEAPSGQERAAEPGFLLVAVPGTPEAPDAGAGQVLGFAHVLEWGDGAHLEQVSVSPAHARQGLGRQLVLAAAREAERRGYADITLRTFASLPFNAPFYAALGFAVTQPHDDFHRGLVATEHALGLDALGDRVQMTLPLSPAAH